jgi:hypothetical protein
MELYFYFIKWEKEDMVMDIVMEVIVMVLGTEDIVLDPSEVTIITTISAQGEEEEVVHH